MKICYVYILGNECRTTLVTGLTTSLSLAASNRMHTGNLLYFEKFQNLKQAIKREKQLRTWKIGWKLSLIRRMNPTLKNLTI